MPPSMAELTWVWSLVEMDAIDVVVMVIPSTMTRALAVRSMLPFGPKVLSQVGGVLFQTLLLLFW